jgi:hypothetical protein
MARPTFESNGPDHFLRKLRKNGKMRLIADRLKIKRQAPYMWRRVPAERVRAIARITGYPLSEIRPDLYPRKRVP